jgi:uncharacterized protein involved in exopolysaccharide biosynthesis
MTFAYSPKWVEEELAEGHIEALPMSAHDIKANVVADATVPRTPEDLDQLRKGILALGLGLMFSFDLTLLMEFFDDSGKSAGKN